MQNPPKIVEVTVTPEYCKQHPFGDSYGCALFHAVKDMGVEVLEVIIRRGFYKDKTQFTIQPPFDHQDYLKVRETRVPFTCLIIPDAPVKDRT